jgi:osmoprotectant transport system permease protein
MFEQVMTYFQNNYESYLSLVMQHITISVTSLIVSVIIGVSAGILSVKYKKTQKSLITLFQTLRIIPSLAILLILLPIMGTGIRPAMTALILLAIPSILINTIVGLEEVPYFVLETAYGLGMTNFQVWRKVRIPLALPMILTGIKTSAIEIIASATLAAKIGAGGLGEIIFTGLGLYRFDLLLIGGLSVALLSISAGLIATLLDRLFLRYKTI